MKSKLKPVVNAGCAPAIWKKLTRAQQLLWNTLHQKFLFEEKDLRRHRAGSKKANPENYLPALMHNLVCEAVWEAQKRDRQLTELIQSGYIK